MAEFDEKYTRVYTNKATPMAMPLENAGNNINLLAYHRCSHLPTTLPKAPITLHFVLKEISSKFMSLFLILKLMKHHRKLHQSDDDIIME